MKLFSLQEYRNRKKFRNLHHLNKLRVHSEEAKRQFEEALLDWYGGDSVQEAYIMFLYSYRRDTKDKRKK